MKKVYFAVAASLLMGTALAIRQLCSTKEEVNLLWENIEALADPEGDNVKVECLFSGDVKCPHNGVMVKNVTKFYSLRERYELK